MSTEFDVLKDFSTNRITHGQIRSAITSQSALYNIEDRIAELEAQVERLNYTLYAVCQVFARLEPAEKT